VLAQEIDAQMSDLPEFLRQRLNRRGDRTTLARRLQVREATVTRWFTGKSIPPFDKCILIAEFCNVDPRDIFKMAGRIEFEALYDRTFPGFKKTSWSEEDLYKNDGHCRLHRSVQKLLAWRSPKLAAYFRQYVRQLEDQLVLIESERLFKGIFEQGPLAMTIIARDHRLLKVNQGFYRTLGYSEQELMSVKLADIVFPDDVESTVVTVDRSLGGASSIYQTTRRYLKRDGSPVRMHLFGRAIVDEDGCPHCVLEMSGDVADQGSCRNQFEQGQSSVGIDSRGLINRSTGAANGLYRGSQR
jgi:PAS domain S-box-containing protein